MMRCALTAARLHQADVELGKAFTVKDVLRKIGITDTPWSE